MRKFVQSHAITNRDCRPIYANAIGLQRGEGSRQHSGAIPRRDASTFLSKGRSTRPLLPVAASCTSSNCQAFPGLTSTSGFSAPSPRRDRLSPVQAPSHGQNPASWAKVSRTASAGINRTLAGVRGAGRFQINPVKNDSGTMKLWPGPSTATVVSRSQIGRKKLDVPVHDHMQKVCGSPSRTSSTCAGKTLQVGDLHHALGQRLVHTIEQRKSSHLLYVICTHRILLGANDYALFASPAIDFCHVDAGCP